MACTVTVIMPMSGAVESIGRVNDNLAERVAVTGESSKTVLFITIILHLPSTL